VWTPNKEIGPLEPLFWSFPFLVFFCIFDVEGWEFEASWLPSSAPNKEMDPLLRFFFGFFSLLLFGSFDVEDWEFKASSLPSSAPIESLGCELGRSCVEVLALVKSGLPLGCKSSVEVLASVKSDLPLCSLQ
jgi:hypothetical protein